MKTGSSAWKKGMSVILAAMLLCGCGGGSKAAASAEDAPNTEIQNAETAEAAGSSQVCPALYNKWEDEKKILYYAENVLEDKPVTYPLSGEELAFDSGCFVTADGKWIYLYENDNDIQTKAICRIPVAELTQDMDKNMALVQRVLPDQELGYYTEMYALSDGSVLVVSDSIYHITDSEEELIQESYTKAEFLGNDVLEYETYDGHYGRISLDGEAKKIRHGDVQIPQDDDATEIGMDENAVYYRVWSYEDDALHFYRADYSGSTKELGSLPLEDFNGSNSMFRVRDGELDIAICQVFIKDYRNGA